MTSSRIAVFVSMLLIKSCQGLTYNIFEEQPINYLVGDIKADGINFDGNITFTIINPLPSNMFRIDSTSGRLYTKVTLDRETICRNETVDCSLQVDVVASDSESTFFKIIKVFVNIIDINDNTPVFPKPLINLDIVENSPLGTMLKIPSPVDQDQGVLSVKTLKIINNNGCPFNLRSNINFTGKISLKLVLSKILDREQCNFYVCNIVAEDGGFPVRSGNMEVNITVLDVNDNTPTFSQNLYNVSICENTPVGSSFLTVSATDADIGLNGEVYYYFSPFQNRTNLDAFDINRQTGTLSITSPLKNENGESITIIVEASDHGRPTLTSKTAVLLNIRTTQNNTSLDIKITSLSNGHIDISESVNVGTVITYIEINDPNNPNGVIDCFSRNGMFKLVRLLKNDFKVIIFQNLDYEMQRLYQFTIICHSGTVSQTKTIVIRIFDENDNPPVFSYAVYSTNVSESVPIGTVILTVKAVDKDSGKNSQIQYILPFNNNNKFQIDSNTGRITLSSVLDRETTAKIELPVIAVDYGNPQLTGSTKVVINVKDVNDGAPQFASHDFHFQVLENTPVFTFVGVVRATDADEGANGQVTISALQNTKIPFSVSSIGQIYTKVLLDRESLSKYVFDIVARDNGSFTVLSTTATVTVDVIDVNDNRPIIVYPNLPNSTITISCDIPSKIPVTKVIAFDADDGQNGQVRYKIQDQNSTNLFHIGSVSGQITVARHLSASDVGRHVLRVIVQDCGIPPLQSEKDIEIVVTSATHGSEQMTHVEEILG